MTEGTEGTKGQMTKGTKFVPDRKIKRFTEKHLNVLKDIYEICDGRLEWDDFILWVYLNTPDEIKNDIRSFRPRDRRIAF